MKARYWLMTLPAIGLIGLMQTMPAPYQTPDAQTAAQHTSVDKTAAYQTLPVAPTAAEQRRATPPPAEGRVIELNPACRDQANTAAAKPEALLLTRTGEDTRGVWLLAYAFCMEDHGYGPAIQTIRQFTTLQPAAAPAPTPASPPAPPHPPRSSAKPLAAKKAAALAQQAH